MNGMRILSDIKFYNDYSKYNEKLERKQTWDERVDSVMDMHRTNPKFKEAFKNKEFVKMFDSAVSAYQEKLVLASQRSLQFSGAPIMKHNAKMYNCTVSYCDRTAVFQEAMYMLLCGCGVGMSFLKPYVAKLPTVSKRTNGTKTYVIQDSIEGWSDAVGVLMSSYFDADRTFPEYKNSVVHFDYSLIRQRGSLIAGGFKAPGHEGLQQSLERIERLLESYITVASIKMTPIIAYDILMHCSDAVLSGGVRRCLPEAYEVQMGDGSWKYIKDCKEGEDILFEGKKYPILNNFKQGLQKLVKITTCDGFHISTANHKWLVRNISTNEIEWRTPDEINGNESNFKLLIKR